MCVLIICKSPNMINAEEFEAGQLQAAITKLKGFDENEADLKEQIEKYFAEYDDDGNAYLDRKELR